MLISTGSLFKDVSSVPLPMFPNGSSKCPRLSVTLLTCFRPSSLPFQLITFIAPPSSVHPLSVGVPQGSVLASCLLALPVSRCRRLAWIHLSQFLLHSSTVLLSYGPFRLDALEPPHTQRFPNPISSPGPPAVCPVLVNEASVCLATQARNQSPLASFRSFSQHI